MLDLLRAELANEPAQELALAIAAFALDLDRRQHVAVALGDREMQAELIGNELLELLADRADQRRVRPEMHRLVHPGDALAGRAEARFARIRAGRAVGGRRCAQPRFPFVGVVRLPQHPSL